MQPELYRTTITLPKEVYQKTKVTAAYQNKSLSRFISDLLQTKVITIDYQHKPMVSFGKYTFKAGKRIARQDIYEDYLKRKLSH